MAKKLELAITVDDKGSIKVRKFGKEVEKATDGATKSTANLSKSTIGATTALTIASSAAVAFCLAVKKSADIGMEFESTMKMVQAVSQANTYQFNQLSKVARDMGKSTEYSASQAAESLKYLSMAGLSVQDSITALPGMLDLATAAQMDLGTASDIVTDTLTAFGMKTSELSRLSDAFIATSTKSNTTVQMLGESFKYVAPVASGLGYTIEETSGYLGTLANSGIKASMAGTDLRQVMLRSAKVAKDLGIEGATLNEVLRKMKHDQLSANEVMEKFGLISGKSALVLMNNVDAVEELTDKIKKLEGVSKTTADTMRDSLQNDLSIAFSAASEAALSMFDAFSPSMRESVKEFTKLIIDLTPYFVAMGDTASAMLQAFTLSLKLGRSMLPKLTDIKVTPGAKEKSQQNILKALGATGITAKKDYELFKEALPEIEIVKETVDKVNEVISSGFTDQKKLRDQHYESAVRSYIELSEIRKKLTKEDTDNTSESSKEVVDIVGRSYQAVAKFRLKELSENKKIKEKEVNDALKLEGKRYQAVAKFRLKEIAQNKKEAENYIELQREKLLASDDFFAGLKLGFKDSEKDFKTWAEEGVRVSNQMSSNMKNAFSDSFFNVLKGDMDALSNVWDSFMNSMLRTLTDTVANMAVQWGIGAIGGVTGWWDSGAWEVKKDHVAMIHKGEMVVPADIASTVRGNSGSSSVSDLAQVSPGGGHEWSDTSIAFLKGTLGASAPVVGQGLSLFSQGSINAEQLLKGLFNPAMIGQAALTGGVPTAANEYLGMRTSKWGTVGQSILTQLGGKLGGPIGAMLGGLTGGAVGMALGDLFNMRSDEKTRDSLEDMMGFFKAQQAYSAYENFGGQNKSTWDTKDIKQYAETGSPVGIGNYDYLSDIYEKKAGGFKYGGISRGPESGYLEKLHGTEAVVPLRNGSIPVQMNKSDSEPIHVHIEIDGREIALAIVNQGTHNTELIQSVRRMSNVS